MSTGGARTRAASMVAALLAAAAVATPARAETNVVVAKGHMRVTGSGVVYTNLRVPEPARFSLNYWDGGLPVPRFSKGDGFAAVVLSPASRGAENYIAARLPQPSTPGVDRVSLGPDICQLDKACEIPAGDYRLYLVSEGKVTVDLLLEGLSGTARVKVSRPAVGELSRATESYHHDAGSSGLEMDAHGAGFSPELTGKSNLLFSVFWFHGPREKVGPPPADKPLLQLGDAGHCSYDGPPPADAYAPGCPGGWERGNHSTWKALSDFDHVQWGSSSNIKAGSYGDGYFAVHSGIRNPGFVGFWLDITP
jgi:hypothetical protein